MDYSPTICFNGQLKKNLNTFDSRLKYLDEYVKIGYIIAYLSSMYKDKLA